MECYDIAIIGAGPAGMTAALYARRAGKRVLLLDGGGYGGQILQSHRIENYPGTPDVSGMELAEQMMSQLRTLELEPTVARVTGVRREASGWSVLCEGAEHRAKAVILATGVTYRRLGVTGEDRFIGRGVSFCATCDGRFFKGREVAVVGGGNTALQDAILLSGLCSRVYLIHRRDVFRAEKYLVDRLQGIQNLEIITDSVIASVNGEFALQSVTVQNVKSGTVREIPVAALFEAVGTVPQNRAFADAVTLDEGGFILTDEDCRTATDGVFAAGDCRSKRVRQLTTATADGTVAALAAVEYLDRLSGV